MVLRKTFSPYIAKPLPLEQPKPVTVQSPVEVRPLPTPATNPAWTDLTSNLSASESAPVENGAFFSWRRGCITVPTNTNEAGGEQLVFESEFIGNGSLIVTGADFAGCHISLNGTDLGTLSSTASGNVLYEAPVTNLTAGSTDLNSFKIWSTSSASGELRRLDAYRNFVAGSISSASGTATWGEITGSGKPEDDATVGATLGTNLNSSTGTSLGDASVITDQGISNDTSNVNSVSSVNISSGANRANSGLSTTGAIAKTIPSTIGKDQGDGTLRVLPQGLNTGTGRDGDSFIFNPARNTIPSILIGAGGLGASTSQWSRYEAKNVTVFGFDLSLKISDIASSITGSTVSGSSTAGTQDLEISKTGSGGSTNEAWNDQYTYQWDWTANGGGDIDDPLDGFITVGFYTNDGSTDGWIKRDTKTLIGIITNNVVTNDTKTLTVDSLGGSTSINEFGITVESVSGEGGSLDAFDKVSWSEASPPTVISATPDGVNSVPFWVLDGEESSLST